jgi:hypothetical protein
MKLYQFVLTGFAVSLMTASQALSEELKNSKAIFIPSHNLFPVECKTVEGTVIAGKYNSYNVNSLFQNIQAGELLFVEVTSSEFAPQVTAQIVRSDSGGVLAGWRTAGVAAIPNLVDEKAPLIMEGQPPRFTFKTSGFESNVLNLYILSSISGKYTVRIAIANPSRELSQAQVDEAMNNSSFIGLEKYRLDVFDAMVAALSERRSTFEIPKMPAVSLRTLCGK